MSDNKLEVIAMGGNSCTQLVHQFVSIEAVVTVVPKVTIGGVTVQCLDASVGTVPCVVHTQSHAQFSVQQNLCLQIPLTFSAEATATPSNFVATTPEIGPCPTQS
jgi:hypothetical protein